MFSLNDLDNLVNFYLDSKIVSIEIKVSRID